MKLLVIFILINVFGLNIALPYGREKTSRGKLISTFFALSYLLLVQIIF